MAVLSRSLGYLFIMAPRTASTATAIHLCTRYEGQRIPRRDLHNPDGTIAVDRKHATLSTLIQHGVIKAAQVNRLFTFTAVRNPFDSLVSLWVKKRTSYQELVGDPTSFVERKPGLADDLRWVLDHTFDEWVAHEYGHLDDGGPHHLYGGYIDGVDFIMRFETLQGDFAEAMRRIGVRDPEPIPMLNETEGREADYRRYYSRETRDLVARIFAADLEVFGYRFDPAKVVVSGASAASLEERARRAERAAAQARWQARVARQEAAEARAALEHLAANPVVRIALALRQRAQRLRARLSPTGPATRGR